MEKKARAWIAVLVVIIVLLFISMFIAGIITAFFGDVETTSIRGSVALIPIKGFITADKAFGYFGEQYVSSADTVEMIEKAEKNSNINAIVLEINSGGGSPVASEEISNAVLKAEKPTVAWIRETGASGAYWIASSADYIVASRMSIVGSVGVLSSYLEFSGLLSDYNVTYQRLTGGKYKDIGTPFKELTDEERELLEKKISSIHDYFIDSVANNRELSKKEINDISTGVFYIGEEAKDIGLIDELGGKDEVTAYLEKKHNIQAEYVEYKTKKSFLEGLAEVFSSFSFNLGKGMIAEDDFRVYAE